MSPLDPLVRPDRFFDRHRWDRLLVTVAPWSSFSRWSAGSGSWAMGWVLADEVTGTTMVDNPAHTPD